MLNHHFYWTTPSTDEEFHRRCYTQAYLVSSRIRVGLHLHALAITIIAYFLSSKFRIRVGLHLHAFGDHVYSIFPKPRARHLCLNIERELAVKVATLRRCIEYYKWEL